MNRLVRAGAALVGVVALGACGDAFSSDRRGYTKAPLEHAGVIIKPEKPSIMNSLGKPIMPKVEVIPPPPDTVAKKT